MRAGGRRYRSSAVPRGEVQLTEGVVTIKVKTLGGIILVIVIIITIFHKQFAWLADFLISPSDNLPDPSQIDLPVVNQLSQGE